MTAIRLDSEDTIEAPSPATRPSDCIARAFRLPNSTPLQQKARKQSVMKTPNGGTPPAAAVAARRAAATSTRPASATIDSRSEEHTSELQSLMRNSYAVFCLKKKTNRTILIQQLELTVTCTSIV